MNQDDNEDYYYDYVDYNAVVENNRKIVEDEEAVKHRRSFSSVDQDLNQKNTLKNEKEKNSRYSLKGRT